VGLELLLNLVFHDGAVEERSEPKKEVAQHESSARRFQAPA
jgi:hypothetical protein